MANGTFEFLLAQLQVYARTALADVQRHSRVLRPQQAEWGQLLINAVTGHVVSLLRYRDLSGVTRSVPNGCGIF